MKKIIIIKESITSRRAEKARKKEHMEIPSKNIPSTKIKKKTPDRYFNDKDLFFVNNLIQNKAQVPNIFFVMSATPTNQNQPKFFHDRSYGLIKLDTQEFVFDIHLKGALPPEQRASSIEQMINKWFHTKDNWSESIQEITQSTELQEQLNNIHYIAKLLPEDITESRYFSTIDQYATKNTVKRSFQSQVVEASITASFAAVNNSVFHKTKKEVLSIQPADARYIISGILKKGRAQPSIQSFQDMGLTFIKNIVWGLPKQEIQGTPTSILDFEETPQVRVRNLEILSSSGDFSNLENKEDTQSTIHKEIKQYFSNKKTV